MVNVEQYENNKLYEEMIKSEKKAYDSQDLLLMAIKKWLSKVISEDSSDHTRIILAEGGYVKIRTVEKLSDDVISDFSNDFGFNICWFKIEEMVDYRSVASIDVKIYEYGFLPKNINEILGNNQVDFGDQNGLD